VLAGRNDPFVSADWTRDPPALRILVVSLYGDALGEAEDLVRQHWDAIERVAQALVERGKLTGDEVDRIWRGG
jgi:hypothetical protein